LSKKKKKKNPSLLKRKTSAMANSILDFIDWKRGTKLIEAFLVAKQKTLKERAFFLDFQTEPIFQLDILIYIIK